MKRIYLDNAATTPVDQRIVAAMQPYFVRAYGNPSEFHALGREAKIALEKARGVVAVFLRARSDEIVFTGSATESINLSHKGLIEALRGDFRGGSKPHIITSAIEHSAVLETCRHLQKTGQATVTYLPVDRFGVVSVEKIKKAIRPETVLVSCMYVNNEIGTIEPIREIGALIKRLNNSGRKHRIYFHTDATQATQYLPCDVKKLNVDFLSFTGHKFYAPKGIGVLFARQTTPCVRQLDGGGQESLARSGTENVPYIVGLAKAISLVQKTKKQSVRATTRLRDMLARGLRAIPGVILTGHPKKRVPHIVSCIVKGVEGEAMILRLSDVGVFASSGSACTSARLAPSHVLTAIGIPPELSHGSLRFSLGRNTTQRDIAYVLQRLPAIIEQLRIMAPVFK